jgi:hypothetical protein
MRIAVQEEGESPPSTRRSSPSQNGHLSLCGIFYTTFGVGELDLRRSTFLISFCCADRHLIRIGDERERLATASLMMTKSRGPCWGQNNHTENGFVKLPRRYTRAHGPAGMFAGKAPLRLVAQTKELSKPPTIIQSTPQSSAAPHMR